MRRSRRKTKIARESWSRTDRSAVAESGLVGNRSIYLSAISRQTREEEQDCDQQHGYRGDHHPTPGVSGCVGLSKAARIPGVDDDRELAFFLLQACGTWGARS